MSFFCMPALKCVMRELKGMSSASGSSKRHTSSAYSLSAAVQTYTVKRGRNLHITQPHLSITLCYKT